MIKKNKFISIFAFIVLIIWIYFSWLSYSLNNSHNMEGLESSELHNPEIKNLENLNRDSQSFSKTKLPIEKLFLTSSELTENWKEGDTSEWETESSGFKKQLYKKMSFEDKNGLELRKKSLEIEIKEAYSIEVAKDFFNKKKAERTGLSGNEGYNYSIFELTIGDLSFGERYTPSLDREASTVWFISEEYVVTIIYYSNFNEDYNSATFNFANKIYDKMR